MLLSDIKHSATLKSIQTKNIDVSLFPDISALRKHIRVLNFKKYHETHKNEYNEQLKKYYNEKKKKLNGLSGMELRSLKKRLNTILKKKQIDMRLR